MKRLFAVLLGSILLLCVISAPASAQSNCSSGWVVGAVGYFAPVGATCTPWGQFVFLLICYGKNTNCAPPPPPGHCPDCCPTCGKPISLATGNTYVAQTDLRIPGLGGGLTLVRTWNSQWPTFQDPSGLFGPNWRSTYEERVFLGSDGYMRYARSDGSLWSFGMGGTGWMVVAPANAGATLVQGSTYWTLTLKNGEQRRFDINSGSLTAIIDRNGNTTQVSYDGTNRLVTVTDPASRHLTFTYPNGTSRLVSSVSSDVGVTVNYAYDGNNRLSVVTLPDQSTLTFQYDSNSNITSVLDANGKVLESHTYDASHRGLTSSRANGVESLSIAYQ